METKQTLVSSFEDLSNELIYEIFEYMNVIHVYDIFAHLNRRFNVLIMKSNFPIKLHLSSMSKSALERFNNNFIQSNVCRIRSMFIFNEFMLNQNSPFSCQLIEFERIETLNINILFKDLVKIVEQLSYLSQLSSLVINCLDDVKDNISSIYLKIFSLIKLKSCKLTLTEYLLSNLELPFCTNPSSSIEHLVITNTIYVEIVKNLLSYMPCLRNVFLNFDDHRVNQTPVHSISLEHLTNLSLNVRMFEVHRIEQMLRDCCRTLQTFRLRTASFRDYQCMNANRWQQLIQSYLLNLRIFDVQFHLFITDPSEYVQIKNEIDQFQTSFWTQRKWFFSYENFDEGKFIFYSKRSYKKTCNLDQLVDESNFHSIKHLQISNEKSLTDYFNYFANVDELTFTKNFSTRFTSIGPVVNRLIPLKQLTKLTFQCQNVSFQTLVELLYVTPNLLDLAFESMLGYADYQKTSDQNDIFRTVSKTNRIKKIAFNGEYRLVKAKLLVSLCPRIENLTIRIYRKDIESIILFLFEKENENIRHMNYLTLCGGGPEASDTVSYLLQSKTKLKDYSIRQTFHKLYLWW